MIFKARDLPEFVEAKKANVRAVSRPTPDRIVVSLSSNPETSTILIKEAYFPTWAAEADGKGLDIQRETSTGYIQVIVPPNTAQVTIYQPPQPNTWNIVSVVSLAVILGLSASLMLTQKRPRRHS
jgi:uncharacterized membrane protein YfhO